MDQYVNYAFNMYSGVSAYINLLPALKTGYDNLQYLLEDLKHASKYYYYCKQFQQHLEETKDTEKICNYQDFVETVNDLGNFIAVFTMCTMNHIVRKIRMEEPIKAKLVEVANAYKQNLSVFKIAVDCGLMAYTSVADINWYRTDLSHIINRVNIQIDIISMELEYEYSGKKCLLTDEQMRQRQVPLNRGDRRGIQQRFDSLQAQIFAMQQERGQ